MPLDRYERSRAEHPFVGKWHLTGMELWDDDFVNMERRAFIEIDPGNQGSFEFALVRGELDGYLENLEGETRRGSRDSTQATSERFMFTWEGFDELDEVSGSGWMRLTSANLAVGLIKVPRWRPMDVHGTSSPAPQDRVRHGITRPLTSEKWP